MRILVAEDDDPVRELLCIFISDLGHEVEAAGNGAELVRLALEKRPDLIITDMQMPEMRGDSMIAMIGMYPPLSGIPVIMVTGATDSDLLDAGIPEEVPVVRKPVNFDKLTDEIQKVANRPGA